MHNVLATLRGTFHLFEIPTTIIFIFSRLSIFLPETTGNYSGRGQNRNNMQRTTYIIHDFCVLVFYTWANIRFGSIFRF